MKVVKWFDEHFEETLLVIFLILIAFVSLLQIIARTFFGGLPWPEEFDRYCWIWTVFLSLPYTIRKGNMLRVNVLVDLFPTKVRNTINILVDAIILTGGVSNDEEFVENIRRYTECIAPVKAYGGDFEMEALAEGALRALRGEEELKEYTGVPVFSDFGPDMPEESQK